MEAEREIMQRVSDNAISSKKTTEQNLHAAKVAISELTDVVNLQSAQIDELKQRVSALESEVKG